MSFLEDSIDPANYLVPGTTISISLAFSSPKPRVPGEQREKLQGALGFTEKVQGTGEEQKKTAPEPEKNK